MNHILVEEDLCHRNMLPVQMCAALNSLLRYMLWRRCEGGNLWLRDPTLHVDGVMFSHKCCHLKRAIVNKLGKILECVPG